VENYGLFLLTGIVFWRFFASGTFRIMRSVTDNLDIIRKVNFPRILLILSSTLSSSITFFIELGIFFVFYFIYSSFIDINTVWILVLVCAELMLVLGLGSMLATVYCFYRDMLPVWQILTQIGFFLTPVFYPISAVPEKYLSLYMLNPVTAIIDIARKILISGLPPDPYSISRLFLISSAILVSGAYIFKINEYKFVRSLK